MKFQFKLEKLLSYKLQILDSEMMNLSVLRKELEENEKILQRLKDNQEQCQREFENKILGKTKPAVLQMYTPYIEDLKQKTKETDQLIEHISNKMLDQIEIIKTVKLETKSLETLKNSRLDEYKKQDLKKVEEQIEEFVITAKINSENF